MVSEDHEHRSEKHFQHLIKSSLIDKVSVTLLYTTSATSRIYGLTYNPLDQSVHNITGLVDPNVIFSRKNIHNLKGKELAIYQMDSTWSKVKNGEIIGLDGMYMKEYLKFINASYHLIYKPGVFNSFGSTSMYFEVLHKIKAYADLSFTKFDFDIYADKYVTPIYPNEFMKYCILVPKAKKLSAYEKGSQMLLQRPAQVFVGVIIFCVGLIWYFVIKIRPPLRLRLIDIYFAIAEIVLINSTNSRMRCFFERTLLMGMIFFFFEIVSGISGIITSYMTVPLYGKDINTIAELNQTNLTVMYREIGSQQIREIYFKNNDGLKFEFWPNSTISHDRAYILPEVEGKQYINSAQNYVNGTMKMHLMQECLSMGFQVYVDSKDKIFEESLTFFLTTIRESGIEEHWKNLYSRHRADDDPVVQSEIITFEIFSQTLHILYLGWSWAVIVFVLEIVNNRIRQRQRR
jgi:hypothetical protein